MKKLLIIILFCNIGIASEKILNFNSAIQVLDNGDMLVTETIEINVENYRIRHGIYRDAPTLYFGTFLSQQKFDIIIMDVNLDNKKVNYTKERLLNGIRIKIGSKNHYVKKGIHTYSIEYLAKQQIKTFDDSEGLYWNVTGSGWIFPIDKASIDINFSMGNPLNVLTSKAWAGKQGSTNQNFTSSITSNSIHFETTKKLRSNEGFTIQTTWDKGFVTNPKNKVWLFIINNIFWFASITMLLLYPLYFYTSWKKVGIDPPKDPVYPIFEPPNTISPAAMRFVRKKHHDNKGFSVAIMNIAAKGFISIEQLSKRKYKLTKLNSNSYSPLSIGERAVFNHLFKHKKTVTISKKYNSRIKTSLSLLENSITSEHQSAFYKDNIKEWFFGIFISLVVLLMTWIHFFNFSSFALPYLFMPLFGILFSAGFLAFADKPIHKIIAALVPACILTFTLMSQSDKVYTAYLVIIFFIIILNALFYHLLQAPTVFGQKLLSKIEGFKLYLNTAEQDRLELMHPPEMTPKLFEKYLPYALALGVENSWSKQFNNAMKSQGKNIDNYQPNWYIGNNYSNFDYATTATSLGAGLASSAIAAATPPSSSTSSSGFGGGGFSGGGGGGGGGGGW